MKFLLYSLNYSPELTGIGKYNGELVQALATKGIDAYVLTAQPYYPEWKIHSGFKNRWSRERIGIRTEVIRCPLYVPRRVTTLRRILHLFCFAASSGLRLFRLLRLKPDILFLVQPTLFCAPLALLYCKLTGAKAVMHIQDFEVDAMFGLGMGSKGRLRRVAQYVESSLLKSFNIVSSISYSMLENAQAKGVDREKLLFFPNWADTSFVTPYVSGEELRADWGFRKEHKIVLYSGNIGKKQGLEIVLDAAEALIADTDVKFLIVGSGAHVDVLQADAKTRGLNNVFFKSLQAWDLVPQMLTMADVHLVVQKAGAADAVLPSKLTNILSVGGHALVTAEAYTELGKIEDKFPGIYDRIDPENGEIFIKKLKEILRRDLSVFNLIARNYALEYLSKDKVLSRFEANLRQLCNPSAE